MAMLRKNEETSYSLPDDDEDDDPKRVANAIGECLHYLGYEAKRIGLFFTAHLIGVAEESIKPGAPCESKNGKDRLS
jgi:hypothetical protein